MPESIAETIVREQQAMERLRSNWEWHWREIAERILPRANDFQQKWYGGEKRTERVFDSRSIVALNYFAAITEWLLTPRTQRWHKLTPQDKRLRANREVRLYLDEVTDLLFAARYSRAANFASQLYECYTNLGAFGTQCLFVDDIVGRGIQYNAIAIAQLFISQDAAGMVDRVHRKFELTARQVLGKWKPEQLPELIRTSADKNPNQLFTFLHCVKPNPQASATPRAFAEMPFMSYYVAYDQKSVIDSGGYMTMPYIVSRWNMSATEVYGRGPAMAVLPEIKMANEMRKTIIRASQKAVDPPLLLYDDGALSTFNTRPNATNYGGVSADGRQLVLPLQTGAKIELGMELLEDTHNLIDEAFLVRLFQILTERKAQSATEAMLRDQEKGALLAPPMGRQQGELLSPMIDRELDILSRAGVLPQAPAMLLDAGGELEIEYMSPLSMFQRADDGVAILRTLETSTGLAQVSEEAALVIDPVLAVRELAEINGVPHKIIRSQEQIAEIMEARRQKQEQMEGIAAAREVSGMIKDQSKAAASQAQAASTAGLAA